MDILIVCALTGMTAFFAVSETVLTKGRQAKSQKVKEYAEDYVLLCRFGIAVSAILLGWTGAAVWNLLHAWLLDRGVGAAASFLAAVCLSCAALLYVMLGILIPKAFAARHAEKWGGIAVPLRGMRWCLYPLLQLMRLCVFLLTGQSKGLDAAASQPAHSEEMLRELVAESFEKGEINHSEYKYVHNIFEFDNRIAKEVMVPRTKMAAMDCSTPLREAMKMMSLEQYTRYPVYDGDKDRIIGLIHFKDVFAEAGYGGTQSIRPYVRPIIQVIESMPLQDLLVKMQRERTHMAILVDEYGGTSGLVTVEDILEEIVGDIQDEFDVDEMPEIQHINEETAVLEGRVRVSEVNRLFGLSIDDSEVDTIGGWLMAEHFGAAQDDCIEVDRHTFRIIEMDGHCAKRIEVTRSPQEAARLIALRQVT
ncbi:hemolysin family protein [Ectobacillus ponti]|uniref:Hemolysin family protein n=1 Tax=Ectobacillus ponti TaxID=2961894 RepID=A0AA41X5E9_9BACI|nr:hemolysin family protein [Ectobacillus ponti]MCP8969239.1 hemolysin family protein [Ectobacillus ponti]